MSDKPFNKLTVGDLLQNAKNHVPNQSYNDQLSYLTIALNKEIKELKPEFLPRFAQTLFPKGVTDKANDDELYKALGDVQLNFGKTSDEQDIASLQSQDDRDAAIKNLSDEKKKDLIEHIKILFADQTHHGVKASNLDWDKNPKQCLEVLQLEAGHKHDALNTLKNKFNELEDVKSLGKITKLEDVQYANGFNSFETARNTNFVATVYEDGTEKKMYLSISDPGIRAGAAKKLYLNKLQTILKNVEELQKNNVANPKQLSDLQSQYNDVKKHLSNVKEGNPNDALEKGQCLTPLDEEFRPTTIKYGYLDDKYTWCITNDLKEQYKDRYTEVSQLSNFKIDNKEALNKKKTELQEALDQKKDDLRKEDLKDDDQPIICTTASVVTQLQEARNKALEGVKDRKNFQDISKSFDDYITEIDKLKGEKLSELDDLEEQDNKEDNLTNKNIKKIAEEERKWFSDNNEKRNDAIQDNDLLERRRLCYTGVGYKELIKTRGEIIESLITIQNNLNDKGTIEYNHVKGYTEMAQDTKASVEALQAKQKEYGKLYDTHWAAIPEDTQKKLTALKNMLGVVNGKEYKNFAELFSSAIIPGSSNGNNKFSDFPRVDTIMDPTLPILEPFRREADKIKEAEHLLEDEYQNTIENQNRGTFTTQFLKDSFQNATGEQNNEGLMDFFAKALYISDVKPDNIGCVKPDGTNGGKLVIFDGNPPKKGSKAINEDCNKYIQYVEETDEDCYNLKNFYKGQLGITDLIKKAGDRFDDFEDVLGDEHIYKALSNRVYEIMEDAKKEGQYTDKMQTFYESLTKTKESFEEHILQNKETINKQDTDKNKAKELENVNESLQEYVNYLDEMANMVAIVAHPNDVKLDDNTEEFETKYSKANNIDEFRKKDQDLREAITKSLEGNGFTNIKPEIEKIDEGFAVFHLNKTQCYIMPLTKNAALQIQDAKVNNNTDVVNALKYAGLVVESKELDTQLQNIKEIKAEDSQQKHDIIHNAEYTKAGMENMTLSKKASNFMNNSKLLHQPSDIFCTMLQQLKNDNDYAQQLLNVYFKHTFEYTDLHKNLQDKMKRLNSTQRKDKLISLWKQYMNMSDKDDAEIIKNIKDKNSDILDIDSITPLQALKSQTQTLKERFLQQIQNIQKLTKEDIVEVFEGKGDYSTLTIPPKDTNNVKKLFSILFNTGCQVEKNMKDQSHAIRTKDCISQFGKKAMEEGIKNNWKAQR